MTHRGMMIAIPEDEWAVFQKLTPVEMAGVLIDLARNVRLALYPKQPRGPKKPKPEKQSGAKIKHVATAKVLKTRHKRHIMTPSKGWVNNQAHQVDDRGEKESACILSFSNILKQLVHGLRRERVFQKGPNHNRDGAVWANRSKTSLSSIRAASMRSW